MGCNECLPIKYRKDDLAFFLFGQYEGSSCYPCNVCREEGSYFISPMKIILTKLIPLVFFEYDHIHIPQGMFSNWMIIRPFQAENPNCMAHIMNPVNFRTNISPYLGRSGVKYLFNWNLVYQDLNSWISCEKVIFGLVRLHSCIKGIYNFSIRIWFI